jgi:hypothetical protein
MVEEPNFPHLLRSFIVITLFSFLLLAIVIGFSNNYGTDTTIINEKIGLDAINSTLSSAQGTATIWEESFKNYGTDTTIFQKIFDITGFLGVGLFKLSAGMIGFITAPFSIFSNILVNVLGIPLIVVAIVNVLIILTVIFGLWSLLRRGV